MPTIVVWGIPTCQSTRKAIKFIEQQTSSSPAFRNLKEQPPTKALLTGLLKKYEGKKLFNVSGASYREGGFKDRAARMTKSEIITAMLADPMLLKRPVVATPNGLTIGYDEDGITSLL